MSSSKKSPKAELGGVTRIGKRQVLVGGVCVLTSEPPYCKFVEAGGWITESQALPLINTGRVIVTD